MAELTLSAFDKATCPNCGKTSKWGTCNEPIRGGARCSNRGFFTDGEVVHCRGCDTHAIARACEHCGKPISVAAFMSLENAAGGLMRSVLAIVAIIVVLGVAVAICAN